MGEPNAGAPRVRVQDAVGRVVNVFLLPPDGEGITVGRALHADVSLPASDLSPLHLRIRWERATGHVTITDLGSANGSYLDGHKLTPELAYLWESTQRLYAGGYTFKLILPAPAADAAPPHLTRRLASVLPAVALMLVALALATYAFLARPAQIVSFALVTDAIDPMLRFHVSDAERIALWVDGQPADPARLIFDPASGVGTYVILPDETDFALTAYNRLGQATTSRLTYLLPTETPRPTLTPSPAEVGLAVFTFNGVNKVSDLSDIIISKGEALLIEWEAVNAESVELQPAGTFKPRDAVRVAPNETTVYTLIARNPFGELRRSVRVVVIDAQATAAAVATMAAFAQATRDAEAAAQAQAAATATAAAQATATAIADAFARAQAAAIAQATQDALAILSATGTAAARQTAHARDAAIAQATITAQQAADATATAVIQATAQAMAARYAQYNGVWANNDPATDGLTRLIITNIGPAITVQAFSYCRPRDCDWGTRSQAFTGEPFSVTFAFGDGVTRRLTFARVGDTLRVTDADSRGPIRTYTFSPAR